MSIIAFLVGFPRRAATSIGASLSARGGESVMYASVASQAAGVTKGAELTPRRGAVTVRHELSVPLLPEEELRDGGSCIKVRSPFSPVTWFALISRTLGKLVIPRSLKLYKVPKRYVISLGSYLVSILAIIATSGEDHLIAYVVAVGVTAMTWYVVQSELRLSVRLIDYSNMGTLPGNHVFISRYIASFVCLGLLMCISVAFLYTIFWPSMFIIILAYFLWLLYLMKLAHSRTCDGSKFVRAKKADGPAPLRDGPHQQMETPQFNYRRRWKDL